MDKHAVDDISIAIHNQVLLQELAFVVAHHVVKILYTLKKWIT